MLVLGYHACILQSIFAVKFNYNPNPNPNPNPILLYATKMAVVGEQWLIRCRKLHITW